MVLIEEIEPQLAYMSEAVRNCIDILLVEDNPQEARLVEKAFAQIDPSCSLRLIINCRTVIEYLREEHHKPKGYRPAAILLDYRMPLNGGLTLAELKEDPILRYLPVFIITGVADEEAIYDLYTRGASCCFQKPPDLHGYEALARLLSNMLHGMLLPRAVLAKKRHWAGHRRSHPDAAG
jgi:chemotaxis family two-component system response regulator Rcp1